MTAYSLPELPYAYDALEPHLSARILELHHGKHHAAYVNGANATIEKIADARSRHDWSGIVGLERTLAFHVSGHLLHTLYWLSMGPQGRREPGGTLAETIVAQYGSYAALQEQLEQVAVAVQGSGWAVLSWDLTGNRLVVEMVGDHHTNTIRDSVALLAIDVWEHAYYLQHLNDRGAYLKAFWNVVDWHNAETLFSAFS